jgi:hypothetical protein
MSYSVYRSVIDLRSGKQTPPETIGSYETAEEADRAIRSFLKAFQLDGRRIDGERERRWGRIHGDERWDFWRECGISKRT